MVYWTFQFADLLDYDTVHLFFVFGALCWVVWLLRMVVSAGYRPVRTAGKATSRVSVLVPILDEATAVVEDTLTSILAAASPDDEVFAIFDERNARQRLELKLTDRRLRCLVAPQGKRMALSAGIQAAANPILVVTASDTRLAPDCLREIVKPFQDDRVGGVCGRVTVQDDAGLGAKAYKWALELRNLMIYPTLSRSGSVHVLNGECYAVRTGLARDYLHEFLNQRFLGRRFDSGDDGWMTTVLLRHHHRTLYQSTALAATRAPQSLLEFMSQQLRWNRNSTRRSLHAVTRRWAYAIGPLYPLHLMLTLFKTPLWLFVITLAFIRWINHQPIGVQSLAWVEPIWSDWRLLLFVAGVIVIRALRGLPYLIQEPRAFLFLPLYAFISPFVLAPLKLYAMVTARSSRWITRGGEYGQWHADAAAVAGLALLLLCFPAVAFAVALTDDEIEQY